MYLQGNQAAFNCVYRNYKKDAERRNLPFELTIQDVYEIIATSYHYCGQQPSQIAYPSRNAEIADGDILLRNGIDRMDSQIGYLLGNVVSCCKQCNRGPKATYRLRTS